MKTKLFTIVMSALLCCGVLEAQTLNANAKATFQNSARAVLGPFSSSTGGAGPITSPWTVVLEQQLKTPNQWDLMIRACFEVGLLTQTTISSKNMVSDTSTASATIKVRVLIDGQTVASPGEVTFGKRTQTLTATLEGAIGNCLSVVTNLSGALTVVVDTNCVTAETIGLIDDSMAAASFDFAVPNEPTGIHTIQVQAQISTMGSAQNGTFTAVGLLGKGALTVESSRLIKDNPNPYTLGQ